MKCTAMFVAVAALALGACSDTTSNPLAPDDAPVAGKEGTAKQGGNANVTAAQMEQSTDWTTGGLGTSNAAFRVGDHVKFRWVRESAPNISQTVTIEWDGGYVSPLASYFPGSSDVKGTDLCNGGAGTPRFCEPANAYLTPTETAAGGITVWGASNVSVSCAGTSCTVTFTPNVFWDYSRSTPVQTTSVVIAWRGQLTASSNTNGANIKMSTPDTSPKSLNVSARAIS